MASSPAESLQLGAIVMDENYKIAHAVFIIDSNYLMASLNFYWDPSILCIARVPYNLSTIMYHVTILAVTLECRRFNRLINVSVIP